MRTTNIRFDGLASGLDTASIVKSMTLGQKAKIDGRVQNKLLLEMKRDLHKEISGKIKDFTTKWAGLGRFEGTFNKVTATVSNKDKVTVNSGKLAGSNTIDSITQLASSAKVKTTTTGFIGSATLGEVGIDFSSGDEIILKVSDSRDDKGEPIEKEIKLTKDMTLDQLSKALGEELKASNVVYDSSAKGFFIATKKTGKDEFISMSVVSRSKNEADQVTREVENTGVLNKLGLGEGAAINPKGGGAIISFNGMTVESNSNTFEVNGVNFTINDTTDKGDKPITINAEQNTEEVFNYIKELVGEYNKLVKDLNDLVGATPNRTYKPLTDEQKAEMTDSDIEAWNKKIKDSLLSNDPTLRGILSDMRSVMGSVIPDADFKTLSSIGIASGSWEDKGELHIDEDKLKKALTENTEGIIQLLAGKDEEKGIIDKLYEKLDSNFKSLAGTKTSLSVFNDVVIKEKITDEAEYILKEEKKLARMEEMYYAKFTAMEKMMSQLNSQSNWLSSQLG